MTDRQRAFLSALTLIYKKTRFTQYQRVGVKRLPQEVYMYEFRGIWLPDMISVNDDRNNRIMSAQFYENPWGVKIDWQGSKRTEQIKIKMQSGLGINGEDGDYFKFDGLFYSPDKVEIKDFSQDAARYVYRVMI